MVTFLHRGTGPVVLDVPAGVERSCEGALHIGPCTAVTITNGEWATVKAELDRLRIGYHVYPAAPKSTKPSPPTASIASIVTTKESVDGKKPVASGAKKKLLAARKDRKNK